MPKIGNNSKFRHILEFLASLHNSLPPKVLLLLLPRIYDGELYISLRKTPNEQFCGSCFDLLRKRKKIM
jgi:hypothetical protein